MARPEPRRARRVAARTRTPCYPRLAAAGAIRDAVSAWVGPAANGVDALANLFIVFKALQVTIFLGWCLYFGDGRLLSPDRPMPALAVGTGWWSPAKPSTPPCSPGSAPPACSTETVSATVRWRSGFPFSWFRPPHNVGTVATIWGVSSPCAAPARLDRPSGDLDGLLRRGPMARGRCDPAAVGRLKRGVLEERLPHLQVRPSTTPGTG